MGKREGEKRDRERNGKKIKKGRERMRARKDRMER